MVTLSTSSIHVHINKHSQENLTMRLTLLDFPNALLNPLDVTNLCYAQLFEVPGSTKPKSSFILTLS